MDRQNRTEPDPRAATRLSNQMQEQVLRVQQTRRNLFAEVHTSSKSRKTIWTASGSTLPLKKNSHKFEVVWPRNKTGAVRAKQRRHNIIPSNADVF